MNPRTKKIYPDSGVELNHFSARNYDTVLNIATLGLYHFFIYKAIRAMNIQYGDAILDLGCGTGRNACIMHKYLNNEGHITGIDVSSVMEKQFNKKCDDYKNIQFIRKRIDQPFDLSDKFDKIFISFVIHGFPHNIRKIVLKNVSHHLKPDGAFFILDYSEFDINEMPLVHRLIFEKMECKYAFDFIKRDWKHILTQYDFSEFQEFLFFRNYIRLLRSRKKYEFD